LKVTVVIPSELLKRFRKAIIDKFGGKKGDLSKAIGEAVELWIKENATREKE